MVGVTDIDQLDNTTHLANFVNDGMDYPTGQPGWTILDSIGLHAESGEAANGRLYAPVNFGPEDAANVEPGADYDGVHFEIEYVARWANSTGHTRDDWDVSNLTDNPLSGFTGTGDWRQSGDPHGTPTFVETSHGIPYGTNLTGSLGSINYPFTSPSTIAGTGHEGRYIFYNNSKFDGNSAANNVSDNSAIPSNKTVYLPGDGQMVLANITNFTKGLNGIMVDLTVGSADHTAINASDFVFKVGENNSPNTWTTLTATPTISVRTGGGISGSDRVDITWADNAIQDQYLEVQVLATAHTGLNATFGTISGNAVGDIFFFGNLRGETASTTPASFARIFASDGAAIQANGTSVNVGINSFLDVDRSNAVISAGDRAALLPLGTKNLVRISIGTAGPFAPEGGGAPRPRPAATRVSRPAWRPPPAARPAAAARWPCRPAWRPGWIRPARPWAWSAPTASCSRTPERLTTRMTPESTTKRSIRSWRG